MRNLIKYILVFIFLGIVYSFENHDSGNLNPPYTIQQVAFDGNNINSWIVNTGVFNQDMRIMNTPGFEWPKGSGSTAIFTTGFCIAGSYNGEIREAMSSYGGEYYPGYIMDSSGLPIGVTDTRFKFYKVNHNDNMFTNPDWLNWGLMVPYGAPFTDVNHNGVYDPAVDTPGVHGATQTIFVCLTDGFIDWHNLGGGFGGGTLPLYAEVHITAWCYDNPIIQDVQFIKWEILNKSHTPWNSTYIGFYCDPDLGCANDDFIGCDTLKRLCYCYNGEDVDCMGSNRYPGIVPSVGYQWLNCSNNNYLELKSFVNPRRMGEGSALCEKEASTPLEAYCFMKGIKKDSTRWVYPPGGNASYVTKYVYSGDSETGQGWTEGPPGNPTGSIWNCGGPNVYTGDYHNPNVYGDRRFVMSSGADNLTIQPGDTTRVMIAQLIAQGNSRLNSVTKLKILADTVKAFCSRGFVIGMQPISSTIPQRFELYQNYPNPFNPKTKIKFSIPAPLNPPEGGTRVVKLVVYDILGREIASLLPPPGGGHLPAERSQAGEELSPGTYEVEFDGSNYPSGVYFYKLIIDDASSATGGPLSITKKMVIVK